MIFFKKLSQKKSSGFSLLETTVAIAIFSGVLLVAMLLFNQVSKIYFRGVSEGKATNTAREVIDNVGRALSTTNSAAVELDTKPGVTASGGWRAWCIDGIVYHYKLHQQLNPKTNPAKFESDQVLVRKANNNCRSIRHTDPNHTSNADSPADELLANRMQLEKFEITSYKDNGQKFLHKIALKLVIGGEHEPIDPTPADDKKPPGFYDPINFKYNDQGTSGDYSDDTIDYCQAGLTVCSVVSLEKDVFQRIR